MCVFFSLPWLPTGPKDFPHQRGVRLLLQTAGLWCGGCAHNSGNKWGYVGISMDIPSKIYRILYIKIAHLV